MFPSSILQPRGGTREDSWQGPLKDHFGSTCCQITAQVKNTTDLNGNTGISPHTEPPPGNASDDIRCAFNVTRTPVQTTGVHVLMQLLTAYLHGAAINLNMLSLQLPNWWFESDDSSILGPISSPSVSRCSAISSNVPSPPAASMALSTMKARSSRVAAPSRSSWQLLKSSWLGT